MGRLAGLAAALLFSVSAGSAAVPGHYLDNVISAMDKAEKKVQTLSFQFKQEADIRMTGDKQVVRGKAFFKRPRKLRVDHSAPQPQTVVSDGETIWLYNPKANQVFTDTWENWAESAGFQKGLLPLQSSISDLRKKYDMELEKRQRIKSKDTAILKLTPLESGPWPYTLRLWIDMDNGIPYRTVMETESVTSVTEMTAVKINPALADDLFTFKTPKGAQNVGNPPPQKKGRP